MSSGDAPCSFRLTASSIRVRSLGEGSCGSAGRKRAEAAGGRPSIASPTARLTPRGTMSHPNTGSTLALTAGLLALTALAPAAATAADTDWTCRASAAYLEAAPLLGDVRIEPISANGVASVANPDRTRCSTQDAGVPDITLPPGALAPPGQIAVRAAFAKTKITPESGAEERAVDRCAGWRDAFGRHQPRAERRPGGGGPRRVRRRGCLRRRRPRPGRHQPGRRAADQRQRDRYSRRRCASRPCWTSFRSSASS